MLVNDPGEALDGTGSSDAAARVVECSHSHCYAAYQRTCPRGRPTLPLVVERIQERKKGVGRQQGTRIAHWTFANYLKPVVPKK